VLRYTATRLAQTIPTLFVISALVFFMMRLIPGDPAMVMAGENATPDVVAGIRESLGLDRPIYQQYLIYLSNVIQGDLGRSIRSKQPVASEVLARLPATFELALAATFIFTTLGVTLGLVAGVRYGRWPDHLVRLVSLFGVSVPEFWLGILMIILFATQLQILPVAGAGTPAHLIMPAITASFAGLALLARVVRTSLVEVLRDDYVRTARAKGLSERTVIVRHALQTALIPGVTVLGLEFGRLLGGLVVVESVFGWPGFGGLLITAIRARDYPIVQAEILLFATLLILVNLIVDLVIGLLDPRIRYA